MRALAIVTLALTLLSAPANASSYVTDKTSRLGFVATYQGESFEGQFTDFTPDIRFDPADLAHSRFDVRIGLASANTDNAERDDLLHGSDFFDASTTADAHFTASKFRALGNNRFVADGTLQLHGLSKPVALTFTWTAGKTATLVGAATLNRLDFNIGTGDWSDTDLLPAAVHVKTTLHLIEKASAATAK